MMTRLPDLPRRVLFIFVDGVGIGTKYPHRNPFFRHPPPFLRELLGGTLPSSRNRHVASSDALCIPLDARLGTWGLPQSGTGQSSLYTGLNTARIIGMHFGPHLYSTLKPVVIANNIFTRLIELRGDIPLAYANAFPERFFDYLAESNNRLAAGMFAAMAAGLPFRDVEALKHGDAVSADITAKRWAHLGHPDAPVITAFEAGRTLARVAAKHALTLYEYFLTDRAGHDQDMEMASQCLNDLDELLRGVYECIDTERTLVVLSSDHGNMEDLSVRMHTRNPVPLLAFGNIGVSALDTIRSIDQVLPVLLEFLSPVTSASPMQSKEDESTSL